jgi:hypothetical protein
MERDTASSCLLLLIGVYLVGAYSLAVILIVNVRMTFFFIKGLEYVSFVLKAKHPASNSTFNSYIEGQNNLSRNCCPMPHDAAVQECV